MRIVHECDEKTWPDMAAAVVAEAIARTISAKGSCNIMLTGGRSAKRLYARWANAKLPFDQMNFYFGDERCVPPDDPDSNYGMAMAALFNSSVPRGCKVYRMYAEDCNLERAAKAYEEVLPETVDVLLLGLGTDGHIASIFPRGTALAAGERRVVRSVAPSSPFDRLTITPKVIAEAGEIFVLATGAEKGRVLAAAATLPYDIAELPARLALRGTWLMDDEAMNTFSSSSGMFLRS